ncbi:chemotaxis protein CheW [Pseudomonas sp. Marseille-QA0892]
MSNPDVVTLPSTLMGLLMPLGDRTLLLPQVAMAELIGYRPAKAAEGAPDWYLGQLEWRDLRLPLIGFEATSGGEVKATERSRIAIINAQGGRSDVKFLGLVLQGIPRSVRLDQSLARADVDLAPFELSAATISGDVARIPDLIALEKALEEAGLI